MNVLEGLEVAIELIDNTADDARMDGNVPGYKYYKEAYEAVKSIYLQIRSKEIEWNVRN